LLPNWSELPREGEADHQFGEYEIREGIGRGPKVPYFWKLWEGENYMA